MDSIGLAHVERLICALEVKFVGLSEFLVGRGYRLEVHGFDHPGIHYNLVGEGRMSVSGGPAFDVRPHMLVILPPKSSFWIEVPGGNVKRVRTERIVVERKGSAIQRHVAGGQAPDVILICGLFEATYGVSTGLFRELAEPIVEHFSIEDRIHAKLETALTELAAQEVGSRAMSDALLKQVIVQLVRRSLGSRTVWAKRFALLRDAQIARALGAMAASPGSAHTVLTLAKAASLGRSAFMDRFTAVTGQTPMTVLRDLRMREAAQYLETTELAVDHVADLVGYASRSSFVRAFRRAYREDPSEYRTRLRGPNAMGKR